MLTHPTLDQLRALKLDGMAEAFAELQTQDRAKDLDHADWLALLLDREAASRNTKRCPDPAPRRPAAPRPGVASRTSTTARRASSTGRCSSSSPPPLDRRAPQSAHHRALRRRQVLARLRARPEGLPRRPHRASTPACRGSSPTSSSPTATAASPGCSARSPRPTC